MELKNLVTANRSYRRFAQDGTITPAMLAEWLNLARQTASARNMQPLKYLLSTTSESNCAIFQQLKWAGYLPDWNPTENEAPTAYVIFCNDKSLSASTPQIDLGIQAQTLLLAATEAGYGGCILLAFNKMEIAQIAQLPDHLDPVLVVALGRPDEKCVIEELPTDCGDIKYYRTADGTHIVPKRKLEDLIIKQI